MTDITSVFIIDPLEHLDLASDTSLALLHESLRRGHRVFYCTLEDLYLEKGEPKARVCSIQFEANHQMLKVNISQIISLNEVDILYIRKDPPVNEAFFHATFILDHLVESIIQINPATALRNHCEKLIPLQFPELLPETIVTRSLKLLEEFREQHESIVIKPMNNCSGRGIFRLTGNDLNRFSIVEQVTQYGSRYVIGQRFLPEISLGDKRVLLLGGKILGWVKRLPKPGDFRSNVNAGGQCTSFELGEMERRICKQVGKWLQQKDIHLAGIDIVGDYLLEVNITSPSCMLEINNLTGDTLESQVLDYVEDCMQGVAWYPQSNKIPVIAVNAS